MQALEVDVCVLQRDDEINFVFFIAQKQVLGVPAGDLTAQGLRLLDREQGRMLYG